EAWPTLAPPDDGFIPQTNLCCEKRAARCRRSYLIAQSERPVTLDRHSTAGARLRIIVPERLMLDTAVVPKGNGMRLPAEAHLKLLARAELAEKIQNGLALFARQSIDMGGEVAV